MLSILNNALAQIIMVLLRLELTRSFVGWSFGMGVEPVVDSTHLWVGSVCGCGYGCSFYECYLIMFFIISEGAKSATGLMEWIEMEVALEAFIIANHQTVYSQGMISDYDYD